jgi:hypothetical protein
MKARRRGYTYLVKQQLNTTRAFGYGHSLFLMGPLLPWPQGTLHKVPRGTWDGKPPNKSTCPEKGRGKWAVPYLLIVKHAPIAPDPKV